MARTRTEQRLLLNRLLALAARPGTKAEGEVAWAKAIAFAEKNGFRIVKKRPPRGSGGMAARHCKHCGAGFVTAHTGRPRIFCSGRCRVAWHRRQHRAR